MRGVTVDRSGFTLVELMVAITILSVALLGLIGTMASTIRVLGEGDRAMTAAYHSSGMMEELEALGCDNLSAGSDTAQAVYVMSWTVSGDSSSAIRDINLVTQYPGVAGQARADTFETALPCIR